MLIGTRRPKNLSELAKLPLLLKVGWCSSILLFSLKLYYLTVRWYVASFPCILKRLSWAFTLSLHYMDTHLGFRCQHLSCSYIDMLIVKKKTKSHFTLEKMLVFHQMTILTSSLFTVSSERLGFLNSKWYWRSETLHVDFLTIDAAFFFNCLLGFIRRQCPLYKAV